MAFTISMGFGRFCEGYCAFWSTQFRIIRLSEDRRGLVSCLDDDDVASQWNLENLTGEYLSTGVLYVGRTYIQIGYGRYLRSTWFRLFRFASNDEMPGARGCR